MSISRKQLIYITILAIANINQAHSLEPGTKDNNSTYNTNNSFVVGIYGSLYDAIRMDSSFEVKMFIEFGANVNHRYKNGTTPLMIASSIGSIKTVKRLLELGADLKLKSYNNMTAIDYASKSNDKLIIDALKSDTVSSPIKSPSDKKNTFDTITAEYIPITEKIH